MTTVGVPSPSLTINSTNIVWPAQFTPNPMARKSLSETGNAFRETGVYQGAGLPDVLFSYDFAFAWEFDQQFVTEVTFLRRLRAKAGPHTLAYWMREPHYYTAIAGQTSLYLPRPDAYASDIPGFTSSEYAATVTVDGVAKTVTYATSVDASTVVAAGSVAISRTSVTHPTSGAQVAFVKFGDTLTAGAEVCIEYIPMFRVTLVEFATERFDASRDDLSLRFVEVN